MPSLKCLECGQRILNPTGLTACPNCGALLTPQLAAPAMEYIPHEEGNQSNPYTGDNPFAHRMRDDVPPASHGYNDDTSPLPNIEPNMMTESPFLKGFPNRPPDIAGTVIQVESHEEPKRSGGAVETIFNTLADFIWAIPGWSAAQQSKEKEKIQVMRMRIRSQDGVQRDARLEGRLTGVNIAQGDAISVWGKKSNGLLTIQQGYNHTTDGTIKTNLMASQHKAKRDGALLLIAAVLIILVIYFSHSLPVDISHILPVNITHVLPWQH